MQFLGFAEIAMFAASPIIVVPSSDESHQLLNVESTSCATSSFSFSNGSFTNAFLNLDDRSSGIFRDVHEIMKGEGSNHSMNLEIPLAQGYRWSTLDICSDAIHDYWSTLDICSDEIHEIMQGSRYREMTLTAILMLKLEESDVYSILNIRFKMRFHLKDCLNCLDIGNIRWEIMFLTSLWPQWHHNLHFTICIFIHPLIRIPKYQGWVTYTVHRMSHQKLTIPSTLKLFDDETNAWPTYKADLKAAFTINRLDALVEDEALSRAQAELLATPTDGVAGIEAVLGEGGAVIRPAIPAIPAHVPTADQLLAVVRHNQGVKDAFALITLTVGPKVKATIAEFEGDGPGAYHHLRSHYESEDMYSVLDDYWTTFNTKLAAGADRAACMAYENTLVYHYTQLKNKGENISDMLKMAIFLGNLPQDQAWENWVQGLRHARNESGGALELKDVRSKFHGEIVRRTVGAGGSSDAVAAVGDCAKKER